MTGPHRESKRCYQLFGHIHSGERRDKNAMDQDLPLHSNQFDVGVDKWDYKPVEVNEFLKIV